MEYRDGKASSWVDSPMFTANFKRGKCLLVIPASAEAVDHFSKFLEKEKIVGVVAIHDEGDYGDTSLTNPAKGPRYSSVWRKREQLLARIQGVPQFSTGSRLFSIVKVYCWVYV